MADSEWYEVPGCTGDMPNLEAAGDVACTAAERTDQPVEVYRCTRTLVRTYTRTVTVTAEDVTPPA